MGIYLLYDFGVSQNLVKKLYEKNITIDEIKQDDACLIDVFGPNSITKIEKVKKSIEKVEELGYNESVYLLIEYGLSVQIINLLKDKNILLDDLLEMNIETLVKQYKLGQTTSEKIILAVQKYAKNEKLEIKTDYSEVINTFFSKIERDYININALESMIAKCMSISHENFLYSLKQLQEQNKITIENENIMIKYITLKQAISNLKKEEWKEVVIRTFRGERFANIGKDKGLSRERVRQIFNKAVSCIPKVKEDMYATFITKYFWDDKSFCEVFGVDRIVYGYLISKYKLGEEEIVELLENDTLSEKQKQILKKNLKLITYKNETIPDSKMKLLELILKNQRHILSSNQIIKIYNEAIEKEISNTSLEKIEEKDHRLVEAMLDRSNYAVASYNRSYRYYDFKLLSDKDKEDLKKLLDIENGIYSATLFFENNEQLMVDLDIQNEYELHNILKRIVSNGNITFGRMPDILIGEKDKVEFLIKEINFLSPISIDDFAKIMHNEFGHNEKTITAFLYNYLSEFITNNILNTKVDELKEKELKEISGKLTRNIYSIEEVQEIIKECLHRDGNKYINNLNLNRIGYKVRQQYIFKSNINSIDEYIRKGILNNDVYIETQEFISAGSSYKWVLTDLLLKNEIYKIDEHKYITKNGLIKRGINLEVIQEKLNKIKMIFKEGEIFNIYLLKNLNIITQVDYLGYGENFLESLFQYSKNIKTVRIEGNVLFAHSRKNYTKFDFMNYIVKNNVPISLEEIQNIIKEKYGFILNKYDIKALINRELYEFDDKTDRFDLVRK